MMTAEERFDAVAGVHQPDRVPACPWLTSDFFTGYYGITSHEWYGSAQRQLAAMLEFYERFPDMQYFPGFRASYGASVEPSGLGCKILYPPEAQPQAEPVVDEIPDDIRKLRVPDPARDGRMPEVLEIYRYLAGELPKHGYRVTAGFLHGPIDVAAEARGMSRLLTDLYENPSAVHELLDITTETCIIWARAQYRAGGGTMKHIMVSDDIGAQLSRKHWLEFSMPYLKRLFETFPKGVIPVAHNCARSAHLLDLYLQTGIGMIQIGPDTDMGMAKDKIGDKVCLIGNLAPLGILLNGTPNEVDEECRELIQKAGAGGGYILGSAGAVARGTPLANIQAMVDAAEKYGIYATN
jgi:MtaA/CmuA family methyltransferase